MAFLTVWKSIQPCDTENNDEYCDTLGLTAEVLMWQHDNNTGYHYSQDRHESWLHNSFTVGRRQTSLN